MIVEKAGHADIGELMSLRLEFLQDDYGFLNDCDIRTIRENLPEYFRAHMNKDLFVYVIRERTVYRIMRIPACRPETDEPGIHKRKNWHCNERLYLPVFPPQGVCKTDNGKDAVRCVGHGNLSDRTEVHGSGVFFI